MAMADKKCDEKGGGVYCKLKDGDAAASVEMHSE